MAQRGNIMRGLRRRAPALPHRRRLGFEPLEDRRLLAALFVNSPLDNTIAGDGLVTLREAILAANNDTTTELGHKGSFADEITFDFGHDGPETIMLTMGQLTINNNVTIVGAGHQLLTIDASGNDPTPDTNNGDGSRVFNIDDGLSTRSNVTISGVTLTGGDITGGGGAIRSLENLVLTDSTITDNSTRSDGSLVPSGGGILSRGGSLTIIRSTLPATRQLALAGAFTIATDN